MEQPAARVGKGSEDSARQWLDTTAAVAADPKGYKQRLAELDAATAAATVAEARAIAAQKAATEMQSVVEAGLQEIDRGKADLEAERKAFTDRSAKSAKHFADQCKAAEAILQHREADLKTKADQADDLNTRLQSREAELNRLIAEEKSLLDGNRLLKEQLEKTLARALEREDAANRAIARVKALASES